MWYVHTVEYYSAMKKNKIMPFAATWMELEIFILGEVSQKEKDKCHIISFISGRKRFFPKRREPHYVQFSTLHNSQDMATNTMCINR